MPQPPSRAPVFARAAGKRLPGTALFKLDGLDIVIDPPRPRQPHIRPPVFVGGAGKRLRGTAMLPPSASVRDRCPPVLDQRPLGSCTAHAFINALRFLHARDGQDVELSRLFCYWVTRVLLERVDPRADVGCTMENVANAVEMYGVCLESLWPYDVALVAERPSQAAFDDAATRRVVDARPLSSLYGIKESIAHGYPVPMQFVVAESVHDDEDGRRPPAWETGAFPLPATDPGLAIDGTPPAGDLDHGVGNHAVMAVAYDDRDKLVTVMNSWGTGFGDGGYGYLSYEFFGPTQDRDLQSHTAPTMAFDAWVVRWPSDESLE